MKILIIYPQPDEPKRARFGFSYELLTLATILKEKHYVKIHDYSCEKYSDSFFLKEIQETAYDAILVECDSFALKRSQNVENARHIISLANNYSQTIAYGNYCYIKKADFTPAQFTVKKNDINSILNEINSLAPDDIIHGLNSYDDLPYIDRSLLLGIPYYRTHQHDTLIQTSKGCQNSCVFCQRKGWQTTYEAHSDDYVLEELQRLADGDFRNIWVIDENFTFELKRAKRLLFKYATSGLTRRPNLFISSWANIDYEFIDLAAKCNIRIISFGIETGNANIQKYYRKNIDLTKVPELIRYANSRGIYTVGNFILGAPMETEETINETFDMIRQCELDQINFKTLDYMIGSELYEQLPSHLKAYDHVFSCAENGLCGFPLDTLVSKKNVFLKSYYLSRKHAIKDKIQKYGAPYDNV